MLQKLIKHMLSSILIHEQCKIFGEVCEEPGKCCLPKWCIENISDYITLMLRVGLMFDSKNMQWRRQVSEFGGAFEGQHAFWGGNIEFHEISPPPRCQNF